MLTGYVTVVSQDDQAEIALLAHEAQLIFPDHRKMVCMQDIRTDKAAQIVQFMMISRPLGCCTYGIDQSLLAIDRVAKADVCPGNVLSIVKYGEQGVTRPGVMKVYQGVVITGMWFFQVSYIPASLLELLHEFPGFTKAGKRYDRLISH